MTLIDVERFLSVSVYLDQKIQLNNKKVWESLSTAVSAVSTEPVMAVNTK